MWHHSRTACVVLFSVASASLQSDPARLFKTHLNKARNQIFHIERSGIFTGEWRGLDCCWSSKEEVLIHAGQNLAPFQFGLHLKRRTQHSFPAPGSRCLSHPCPYIRIRHRCSLPPSSPSSAPYSTGRAWGSRGWRRRACRGTGTAGLAARGPALFLNLDTTLMKQLVPNGHVEATSRN